VATKIIRGLYNIRPQHKSSVVTMGNFDGVHRGHQALIAKLIEKANVLQAPSTIITFEPLPKEYFGRDQSVPRLTRWREKFYAFEKSGIDNVLVLHFDEKLANLSAEDFVKQVLCDGLAIRHIIIGDDFRFGCRRQGDFHYLQNAGKQYGFTVEDIPTLIVDDERVSSTRVREALITANHPLAEKLLGRPYTLQGQVIHGDQRGRMLGFPTANICLHRRVTPVRGVYSVRLHGIDQRGLAGVANVGVRPTLDGTRSLLEVHLFDFDRDIYGKQVSVEFCEKIRDEKRFESLDLLKEQIWKDAAMAREFFVKRGELK
jgi:riboflavin kinase/FMN adenylyltransferase